MFKKLCDVGSYPITTYMRGCYLRLETTQPASEQYTTNRNEACIPAVNVDGTSQYLPGLHIRVGMHTPDNASL